MKKFVDHAFGGRAFAGIEEDDLHHAADADEMIGLLFVIVPGLGDTGVGGGHVDLAELDLLQVLVVGADHLHEAGPRSSQWIWSFLTVTPWMSCLGMGVGDFGGGAREMQLPYRFTAEAQRRREEFNFLHQSVASWCK